MNYAEKSLCRNVYGDYISQKIHFMVDGGIGRGAFGHPIRLFYHFQLISVLIRHYYVLNWNKCIAFIGQCKFLRIFFHSELNEMHT